MSPQRPMLEDTSTNSNVFVLQHLWLKKRLKTSSDDVVAFQRNLGSWWQDIENEERKKNVLVDFCCRMKKNGHFGSRRRLAATSTTTLTTNKKCPRNVDPHRHDSQKIYASTTYPTKLSLESSFLRSAIAVGFMFLKKSVLWKRY